MPGITEYIIKLNICLAVVYLFYHFLLRRLTFYNWNRWYLLGYTVLSFIIPLVNVMPSLQRQNLHETAVIQWIPAIHFAGATQNNFLETLTLWDWAGIAMMLGALVLLIRLTIRLYSLYRIKANAQLISGDGTKIYQLNENITPFSFGNAIFINTELHDGEELEEIIRHEFVHIKQKHTIDIIWCELMCIINWFNPFVWLLRHSVKQNLEFIADDKVLQNGIDKTTYQYLLLKVVGHPQFAFTHHFNFSALKKRIAMMNTLKTAKIHLARFAFLLPVVAVLLLSFRNESNASKPTVRHPPTKISSEEKVTPFIADTLPGVKLIPTEPAIEKRDTIKLAGVLSSPEENTPIAFSRTGEYRGITLSRVIASDNKIDTILPGKIVRTSFSNDVMYIVDGVPGTAETLSSLDPNKIESISVAKGQHAVALYGPNAAKGVISIITKKERQIKELSVTGNGQVVIKVGDVTLSADSTAFNPIQAPPLNNANHAKAQQERLERLPDNLYYILDGEKSSRRKVDKINFGDIERMEVLNENEARRFYGKKGKNGAVVVTTKQR